MRKEQFSVKQNRKINTKTLIFIGMWLVLLLLLLACLLFGSKFTISNATLAQTLPLESLL